MSCRVNSRTEIITPLRFKRNMYMNTKALLLIVSSISLASLSHAQWSELNSETFDSYSAGSQPAGDWYNSNATTTGGANGIVTDQDGVASGDSSNGVIQPASVFTGQGNALSFIDSTTANVRAGLDAGDQNYDILRYSLDFSFVSVTTDTSNFGNIVFTSAGNTAFNAGTDQALAIGLKNNGSLTWAGGGSTAVSNPTGVHTMDIVANGTDSDFSYSSLETGGTTTLSGKTFDLYVDGLQVATSVAFTTSSVELGRWGLATFGSSTGQFMVDDLTSYTSVPEPSQASALLGLVAAAMTCLVARRRR